MRGCDADHTARAGAASLGRAAALHAILDTSGRRAIARRSAPSSRACKAVVRSIWATASGGLTGREQNRNIWRWTTASASLSIPSWSSGSPAGSARAMGLSDWRDLLDRFSNDCLWRAEARGKRGVSACGVYLPDLEQPRPPDLPPGLVRLRVVVSND